MDQSFHTDSFFKKYPDIGRERPKIGDTYSNLLLMNVEKYSFTEGNQGFSYEFYSISSKGRIKKIVQYSKYEGLKGELYNLGFGDLNEQTGLIDDTAISNNNDRDKVLATVASTIIHFLDICPSAILFAEGSSPVRTRLYQISISKFWDKIAEKIEVQGLIGKNWEPFCKGRNYDAFLIRRK